MFAKNEYSKKVFQENWNELVKKRSYIAIVEGILEKKEATLKNYLKETSTHLVYVSKNKDGKEAITSYKVVKQGKKYSELKIEIETGRKNQIRVHMAYIGHPLLGDPAYGQGRMADLCRRLGFQRQALHAAGLGFVHPATGAELALESPLPADIQQLLIALETVEGRRNA